MCVRALCTLLVNQLVKVVDSTTALHLILDLIVVTARKLTLRTHSEVMLRAKGFVIPRVGASIHDDKILIDPCSIVFMLA